jgi:hypothetical protein
LGYCNDTRAACVQCKIDANCDDGKFCNGAETCVNDMCVVGTRRLQKCVGSENSTCPPTPIAGRVVTPVRIRGSPVRPCRFWRACTGTYRPSYALRRGEQPVRTMPECYGLHRLELLHDRRLRVQCMHLPAGSCDVPTGCIATAMKSAQTGWAPHVRNLTRTAVRRTIQDCGDNASCTVDNCNEATDQCNQTPNNALCPGSTWACDGTETCNPAWERTRRCMGHSWTAVPSTRIAARHLRRTCRLLTAWAIHQPRRRVQRQQSPQFFMATAGFAWKPPAANDPWRCVRLEWAAPRPTTVLPGRPSSLGCLPWPMGTRPRL